MLSNLLKSLSIFASNNTGAMTITIIAIIGITAVLAIAVFKNKD